MLYCFQQFDRLNFDGPAGKHHKHQIFPESKQMMTALLESILHFLNQCLYCNNSKITLLNHEMFVTVEIQLQYSRILLSYKHCD